MQTVYFAKSSGNCKITLYNFSVMKYNAAIRHRPDANSERKKEYEKSIAWILTVIMMLALLTGCGSKSAKSDTEYVKKNGKLIVGITDYEPMDYKDENGEWTGFDAEFARMFAKELGVDCEFFVIADWGQKFFELDSKNIDAIWNGMTITDEVTLNTSCSNPYVVNAQVVIMKADVVGNYTSTDSLKDLTFAVESGSAGEDAVKGLGISDYVAVQDQTKAVMEVSAGTADACVVDITLANAMTGEGTNYDDLASGISLSSEEYGVGFRKESDLTDAFNKFMEKCLADGSLQALADKYSLTLVG